MGGGSSSTTINAGTRYNSLGLQSSQQGLPIPIIYGTVKVSGNLIWYGDFTEHKHEESTESGGKGGGSHETTVVTYTYSCAVAIGIGEGEIGGYGKVWTASGTTTLSALNLSGFLGTTPQTPWSYLLTKHPEEALAYPSTAYLASGEFDLGSYNNLPQLWFEVVGMLNDTGVTDNAVNPANLIRDFLTNTRYGCHFPEEFIDDASLFTDGASYSRYCGVNGIAFAMSINEQKQAREHLGDWLEATNTAPVWSGDKLKFIPFGDKSMTGYGFTYEPNLMSFYDLTEDDFLAEAGEEPVEISRADPYDCYNNVKVQVRDRENEYNLAICEVKDQASIDVIGLRTRDLISAEFIPTPKAGMMAAELIKNRGLYIRNHYRFRLSWEYGLLEPMDLVTLTLPELGLDRKPVRIMEISEDDEGRLEIEAEEFLEGSQWSVQYLAQGSSGYVGDLMVDPGDVNPTVVFEPPSELLGLTNPEVWAVITGNPATWGGARVWLSLDGGENYFAIGLAEKGGITGMLTTELTSNGTTMVVEVSECGGELSSVSASEAALGRTIMRVGDEIIAYTTATLIGPGRYELSGLVRGMYGSAIGVHAEGSRFGYFGGSVFKYVIPNADYYGETVRLKFTSYNLYGAAMQGLDVVAEYLYTITGDGAAAEGGGSTGELVQIYSGGVNTTVAPGYSTSLYASKGTTFHVGVRDLSVVSVSTLINDDPVATYKCVLASVDIAAPSSPITAILGVSDETALASPTAGSKTFHFSDAVLVEAGSYLAVIITRTDATATTICEVSFPGSATQDLLTSSDLVYREAVRFASTDPAVGEQTLSTGNAYTSAVAMAVFYTR